MMFLNSYLFLLDVFECFCLHAYLCISECLVLEEAREDVGSLGNGIATMQMLRTKHGSCAKAANPFNHRVVSLAPCVVNSIGLFVFIFSLSLICVYQSKVLITIVMRMIMCPSFPCLAIVSNLLNVTLFPSILKMYLTENTMMS